MDALEEIYREYQSRGNGAVRKVADRFYPPLLVQPSSLWNLARHRIAYVGQETFGWTWDAERVGTGLDDLGAFFDQQDSVERLMAGYVTPETSFERPSLPRGFFWSYLKRIVDALGADGASVSSIWTNLIRCAAGDEQPYTLATLPEEVQDTYLSWQKGLIKSELHILRPTVTIFVTGPNYDQYLLNEFNGVTFEALAGFTTRQAARLRHADLSGPTYRTYHPQYLNRSLGFEPIQAILKDLNEQQ